MKKIFKAGGITIILGVIIAIVGAVFNGVRAVEFVNLKPQIVQKGKKITKNYSATDFTTIKFDNNNADGSAYDVEIKQGSGYKVTYTGNSKYEPKVSVSNDSLTITPSKRNHSTVGFYYTNYESRVGKITITVPENVKLDKLSLEGFVRSLVLSDLNITELTSDKHTYADAATFKNLTVDQLELNLGVGDELFIKDSKLSNGTLDFSGDLRVSGGELTDIAITSNQDGDVDFLNGTTITNGSVKLTDADFTANGVTFHGKYEVTNKDGDNNVSNVTVQGYRIVTTDGTNTLFDQVQNNGGTLEQNTDQADVLTLTNTDGDNTVK